MLFSRNFSRNDGDDPAAFEGLGTQALGYGLVGAAVAAQPPAGASAHVPADAAADGAQAVFEAGGALGGLVVKAGLVVVELVALAVLLWREVGHHDVGAVGDAELAAVVADGLKGRGGGDVDGA